MSTESAVGLVEPVPVRATGRISTHTGGCVARPRGKSQLHLRWTSSKALQTCHLDAHIHTHVRTDMKLQVQNKRHIQVISSHFRTIFAAQSLQGARTSQERCTIICKDTVQSTTHRRRRPMVTHANHNRPNMNDK